MTVSEASEIADLGPEIADLERFLFQFRSADTIANLAFFETVQTGRFQQGEAPQEGQILIAEYAAQLYWGRPLDDPRAEAPPHVAIEEARARIDSILVRQGKLYMQLSTSDQLESRLRGRLQLSGLLIRNPGAPGLWESIISRLTQPLEDRFCAQLGFCAADVVGVYAYLRKSLDPRLKAHFGRISELDDPRGLFYRLSDVYRFSLDDVASGTGMNASTVQRIFDAFGLRRETAESSPRPPSSHHPYMNRPLLMESATSALVISPTQLLWALLPGLDDLLRDTELRETYLRRRDDFLEREVQRIFQHLAGRDAVWRGVQYYDQQGISRGDIDVLATLDTTCFLVECKAERLQDAPRRGAEISFRNSLKSLLYKAYEQLMKADAALEDLRVRFEARRQDPEFRRPSCPERQPLIITLDHTSAIGSSSFDFADFGAFGARAPWTVSLLELSMAADVLESGIELKNYLRRRLETYVSQSSRVNALDELDYLGTYMVAGYCRLRQEQNEWLVPGRLLIDIGNYFAGRGSKPGRNVPDLVRELLGRLQDSGRTQWSEMACDILALDPHNLHQLAENIARARADRGYFTTLFKDGSGIGIAYACTEQDAFGYALREIAHDFMTEQPAEHIIVLLESPDSIFFEWYSVYAELGTVVARGPLGTALDQRPDSSLLRDAPDAA